MTLGRYTVDLVADHLLLAFFILAAAAVLAYRAYRPSRPAATVPFVLFVVRSAALLLAVLLLTAPRLTVSANGVRLPLIAVLTDDSESMRIRAGDAPRHDTVLSLESSGAFDGLDDRARVRHYRFSEGARTVVSADTARWTGTATDIATSLDQVAAEARGDGLAGVILLSDGAHNLGESPLHVAEEIGVPVYPVPIGADAPPKDVAVTAVAHPSLGYVGRPLRLTVTIDAVGVDREETMVRVLDGERVLAATPVAVRSGQQEAVVDVVPDRPGVRTLTVAVPPVAGEVEPQNNRILTQAEILAGRARVLLVGTPSPDFAYLKRLMDADSNVVVETIYPDSPRGWPFRVSSQLETAGDRDLVVLHDVPGALLTPEAEAGLDRFVREGGALLVNGGAGSLVRGWGGPTLAGLLPVSFDQGEHAAGPTQVRLGAGGQHHAVVRMTDDLAADREAWEALPPLASVCTVRAKEGATVLLEAAETGTPVAAVANAGKGKVAAVAATGFARQALMMWGVGGTDRVTRSFWSRMTRWLLTREDVARLRVSTEKRLHRSGEPVGFRVEFFDDLLRPVDGAEVVLDFLEAGARTAVLGGRGGGVYAGRVPGLPQGVHPFRVTAGLPDRPEQTSVVDTLTVGRYSVEFEDLLANAVLLEDVARASGGRTVAADGLPAFVDSLKLAPQPHTTVYAIRLWGREWPLALLVVLLAGEWFVRRRRGML